MRVDHRRRHIAVTEQLLDRPDVVTALEQVRRKRVAERVAAHALVDSRLVRGTSPGPLYV